MDICGYIDYQYNILNRSLLEVEIEYQHECFETLKKKYNAYINEEADESRNVGFKNKVRAFTVAISNFFEKIKNAMQRWIVRIIGRSNKVGARVQNIFDDQFFQSPDLDIRGLCVDIVDALDDVSNAQDYSEIEKILKNILNEIHEGLTSYSSTSYAFEIRSLLAYKGSIKTINDQKKNIIDVARAEGSVDHTIMIKEQLKIVKLYVKAIQKRATYAAKLILKAAEIAYNGGMDIPAKELQAMKNDIYDFDFNELVLKAGASKNFFDNDDIPEEDD